MKFYLSSYKIGNQGNKLKELFNKGNKIVHIGNALDFSNDQKRKKESEIRELSDLRSIGLNPENLDLKDYFGKKKLLENKLKSIDGVWIRGGNTFVLRQAMKLSGFDKIITSNILKDDFVYAGYSAAICVLSESLKGIHIMDHPEKKPYGNKRNIWKGLNLIDYYIIPHYKSNHFESKMANDVLDYYKKKKLKFKTLSDGQVIIIDKTKKTNIY